MKNSNTGLALERPNDPKTEILYHQKDLLKCKTGYFDWKPNLICKFNSPYQAQLLYAKLST